MSTPPAPGRFVFREAGVDDDGVLREILRATALPGWVTLSYEREPSYFAGCAIEGDTISILATTAHGEPVGFFCRAVRQAWIDGRPQRLGYLGQLRVLPKWQARSRAILHGFRVVRELLDDGRQDTPYLLTSILADNTRAQRILTSGVGDLPTYLPVRSFLTLVAATRQRWAANAPTAPYELRAATAADLDTLLDLLHDYGRRYDLHPYWDADELRALQPVGWRPDASLLLLKDGQPKGCGTVWDQRAVRQWRVDGYAGPLAPLRPFASTALSLAGYPPLPRPGQTLEQGFLSHLALLAGEETALPVLLAGLLRLAHARGLGSVALGFSDDHPWLPWLTGLRALRYHSQLYLVHWPPGRQAAQAVLGAPVQTEVACL